MNIFKPKLIAILLAIGTVYFVFVVFVGASCYGMECIGLIAFGTPVFIGSLPWGLLANIFPDTLPKEGGLLISPFLKPSTWPGLFTIYLGFMFNLWLLGKCLIWVITRMKNTHNNEIRS